MKENVWRAKRLTREMLTYWKRYDRNERETRKKQEKEAEEQRKMDVELMEVSYIFIKKSFSGSLGSLSRLLDWVSIKKKIYISTKMFL